MALQAPEMIPFLGLTVTGDIGELTVYTTRRNKIVYFPKAPPGKPPSAKQLVVRQRWRQAIAEWNTKPKADRAEWERIVQAAGLRITGYNYFISLFVHPDPYGKATIERLAEATFP